MANQEEIFNRTNQLKFWLQKQSIPVSRALAVRAAMRTLPFVQNTDKTAQLSIIRAHFLIWAALRYPNAKIDTSFARIHLSSAAYSKGDYSLQKVISSTEKASETITSPWPKEVKRSMAAYNATESLGHSYNAAYDFALEKYSEDGSDAIAFQDFLQQAESDARLLANDSSSIEHLLGKSLWSSGLPESFSQPYEAFIGKLEKNDSSWKVWLDWYDRRIRGDSSVFGLSPEMDERLTLKIVNQDQAFWDREPDLVNREISEWLEEERLAAAVVEQDPGPSMAINSQGKIDAQNSGIATSSDFDEISQMREVMLEALDELIGAIRGSNAYASISSAATKYKDVISADIENLSIDKLYAYGLRLENARFRLKTEIESGEAPEMAVPVGEALDSVVGFHGPMILSTERGEVLVVRARRYNYNDQYVEELKDKSFLLATAVENDSSLFAEPGKDLIVSANRDVGAGPDPQRSTENALIINGNTFKTIAKAIIHGGFVVGGAVITDGILNTSYISATSQGVTKFLEVAPQFLMKHMPLLREYAAIVGADIAWLNAFLDWFERKYPKK